MGKSFNEEAATSRPPVYLQVLRDDHLERRGNIWSYHYRRWRFKARNHATAWCNRSVWTLRHALSLSGIETEQTVTDDAVKFCKDYVYVKIKRSGHSHSTRAAVRAHTGELDPKPPMTSLELRSVCREMESLYPTLFLNISSQMNVKLTSNEAVADVLRFVLKELFSTGITWGRIVAMYCITGALAVDCLDRRQPKYVATVIATMGEFVRLNVASWVVQQGGWEAFEKEFKYGNSLNLMWILSGLGTFIGFLGTLAVMLRNY